MKTRAERILRRNELRKEASKLVIRAGTAARDLYLDGEELQELADKLMVAAFEVKQAEEAAKCTQ